MTQTISFQLEEPEQEFVADFVQALVLVAEQALAYDLIFNHCFYNPVLASIIVTYTYATYKA